MWKVRASSGITDMFHQLHGFLQEKKMDFRTIKHQVTAHLAGMLAKFNSFFPELIEEEAASYLWIRNPFTENIEAKLPDCYPSKLEEAGAEWPSGRPISSSEPARRLPCAAV
ncbi:hypothetical protein GJAV_G00136970 [Gymnothorax javanicus]|nr:hypothetical protein GJAV_G00136970 [Gymnothorax javanicus]